MRILLVEDDDDARAFLQSRLEEKCFAVDAVSTGERALKEARLNEYDLILLDYSLPEKNGFEVCETLREEHNTTPIIIISATHEVPHKVKGFMVGIDDYVTKPFFFEELYARIHAILRRPKAQEPTILTIDNLTLNTLKQEVTRGKISIYLTRKEFSLLEYLLKHQGIVVSRGAIMEHIWDVSLDPFSNTIETHILNLRKKIDQTPHKKLIYSVPGRGYKIDMRK